MAKADLLQAMREKANSAAEAAAIPAKQANSGAEKVAQPPSRAGKRQVAAYFPRTCSEATQAFDGRE